MSLNGLCVKNRSLPNVLIAQSALRGEHIDKYHSKVRGRGRKTKYAVVDRGLRERRREIVDTRRYVETGYREIEIYNTKTIILN
nr:MAG TPA: hypothetical protein [Caudoviricetes sp.]